MPSPSGFTFTVRKSGAVVILHHGRPATTLRGVTARRFLDEVDRGDAQAVMARATGNYRRGNERDAASHPRNGRRER